MTTATKEIRQVVSVRLPPTLIKEFTEYTKQRRTTRTAVVERLIRNAIKERG